MLGRIVVVLFGLLASGLALGFWVAPDATGDLFGLDPAGVAGVITLRADLGGLFAGLAVLCLVGVAQKQPALLIAAAVLLGAAAFGRTVGMVAGGEWRGQIDDLGIEIGTLVACLASARSFADRAQAGATSNAWTPHGGRSR